MQLTRNDSDIELDETKNLIELISDKEEKEIAKNL